eukprot:TRINITY_DN8107_c0_g1_i4.p1 TRINITY_DN8107_c0_g1~~TRINITY_DN8107_c0_g1_i4.p1  ORF type:complete len:402 (+),score=32.25 TRINITY_DN8107_c0_g1_i4:224-1429(+)
MAVKASHSAAFGTTSDRFSCAGIYPKSLAPGTCISSTYKVKEEVKSLHLHSRSPKLVLLQDAQRGPGCHEIPLDLTAMAAAKTTSRQNKPYWSRESDHPHKARLDSDSHRRALQLQKLRERISLGPGTYNIKGISDPESTKVYMSISRSGPRMNPENRFVEGLPGPGYYGSPEGKLRNYQQAKKAASRKGMMEASGRQDTQLPVLSSNLPPGHYTDAEAQPLLKTDVGKRGQFDTHTGPRFKPHKPWHSLAPGQYGEPSLAPLSTTARAQPPGFAHGKRLARDGGRLEISSLVHAPRSPDDPGPGHFHTEKQDLATMARRPSTAPDVSFNARHDRRTLFDDVKRSAARTMTAPAQYNIKTSATLRRQPTTNKGQMASTVPRFTIRGQQHSYAVERLRSQSR